MGLRLRRASSDGGPGDEVAKVLRRDRIERFGRGRQSKFRDVPQEATGVLHSLVDAERIIHVRVVDITLPAGGGARFFEINAHHEEQGIRDLVGKCLQTASIFEPGDGVVNGAGANHGKEAVVLAVEDVTQGFSAAHDGLLGFGRKGNSGVNVLWRGHRFKVDDVDVLDFRGVEVGLVRMIHFVSFLSKSLTAVTRSASVGQCRLNRSLSCPASW